MLLVHGFKVARYSFSGQYLRNLSINYVAINKDLEKLHHSCIR